MPLMAMNLYYLYRIDYSDEVVNEVESIRLLMVVMVVYWVV